MSDHLSDLKSAEASEELSRYRVAAMEKHNFSSRHIDLLIESFPSKTAALAFFKETLGAIHQDQYVSDFLKEELPYIQIDMIAGDDYTGKTYRALEMAIGAAAQSGDAVLIFSKETLAATVHAILGDLQSDYGNMRIQQTPQDLMDFVDDGKYSTPLDETIVVIDDASITDQAIAEFVKFHHTALDHVIVVVGAQPSPFKIDRMRWLDDFDAKRYVVNKYLTQRTVDPDYPFYMRKLG